MVAIFAKRFEDLPLVRRLGDVIRIHGAHVKAFRDIKQIRLDIVADNCWSLFSTYESPEEEALDIDDEYPDNNSGEDQEMEDATKNERNHEKEEKKKYAPYKFSGINKGYFFDSDNEKPILDNLRGWSVDYYGRNLVITQEMYKLLKDAKNVEGENKEFDLLCKVLKVFEKDETSLELRIKDISQE